MKRGFPSHDEVMAAMRHHQNALVGLGYFERRSFALPLSIDGADPRFWTQFPRALLTNTWSMEVFSENKLARFTARPEDMKVIESLIGEWVKADARLSSENDGI